MSTRNLLLRLAAFAPAVPLDIRDIRGPVHIPSPFRGLVLAVIAVGILVLAYAAYSWVRRFRRDRVKTPEQIALARLERARELAKGGRVEAVCDEVSNAVRAYVEARFPVRAAHRTTEEFLRDLISMPRSPVAEHREALADFLGACDLVKFARFSMASEPLANVIDGAEAFVRATAIVEVKKEMNAHGSTAEASG